VHIALVTGASRGIGRAIAIRLAQDGHFVILNYRSNHDKAQEVVKIIEDQGGKCEPLAFDVTDVKAVKSALKEANNTHKKIDIVVNNAGIVKDQIFPLIKEDDWNKVIGTSLNGFFAVTKYCIRGMLNQHWGRIINISSAAGLVGNPGQTAYSAAKAGLIGATRSLSAELSSRGILVNAIAPGFIETDLTEENPLDEEIIERIPMGRMGTPEEVANLVSFLASEQASYITGQAISINGGMF
jgi:3-oxoacyl-[acyl-carrier protein] reductase